MCNVGPDFPFPQQVLQQSNGQSYEADDHGERKGLSSRLAHVRPPQSSTAIYPAPKMATDCGNSSHANTSSEVATKFFPSTFGMTGLALSQ